MTRPLWLLLLLVAWNAGCAGTPEGQDEHEGHHDEEGEKESLDPHKLK